MTVRDVLDRKTYEAVVEERLFSLRGRMGDPQIASDLLYGFYHDGISMTDVNNLIATYFTAYNQGIHDHVNNSDQNLSAYVYDSTVNSS